MLVTDIGDEISWGQLEDVCDKFGHLGNQNPQFFTLASGTNIQKMSPRSKFGHPHPKFT